MSASDAIRAGQREVIVAGGVENMSRNERRKGIDSYAGIAEQYDAAGLAIGQTVETVAREYDISREEQDAYGARSQQRARSRRPRPVRSTTKSSPSKRTTGSSPRTRAPSRHDGRKKIAGLPPAFEEEGTVTAANASQVSDGAAGVLITSEEFAEERDLEIMAEIGDHNVAGVDPTVMGIRARSGSPRNLGAQRSVGRRLRPRGTQRGLRESDDLLPGRTWLRRRQLQRQRRAIAIGHPLVPPARPSRDADPRTPAPGRRAGPLDDVRRLRARRGRRVQRRLRRSNLFGSLSRIVRDFWSRIPSERHFVP